MSKLFPLTKLRVVRSMDSVSPYQTLVYTFIFCWNVYSILIRHSEDWWWVTPTGSVALVEGVAITIILFWGPIFALAGFFLRHKEVGIWVTLSADSAIMFAMLGYSAELMQSDGRLIELAHAISWSITVGIAMRVIRDVLYVRIINRQANISDESIERAKQALSTKAAERHLELQAAEEAVELRQVESALLGILHLLKQRYNG